MHDVAIIGGGLAGLAAADALERAGRHWVLLEARSRLGGRILSRPAPDEPEEAARYDLGPAWLWPHNARLLRLAERFGVRVFEQHAAGRLVFEDGGGALRRDLDFHPMAGALRLEGGMRALVDGLAAGLPHTQVHLEKPISRIVFEDGAYTIHTAEGGEQASRAGQIVLALPPRLAASIAIDPPLPEAASKALAEIPTWMAGHAKAVAVYDTPFWRAEGLSGSAISHMGPLAEVHDASPADGSTGALFGFFGVPATVRAEHATALEAAVRAQLGRLFGAAAASPRTVMLQDWAAEPETAVPADHAGPAGHPAYGMPRSVAALAERGLFFAGSEMATRDGGFLEGALEAAEAAVRAATTASRLSA
ncbi:MAG: FAD-dependent oxidoreductase [Pseudomonadota bacterium]